MRSAAMRRVSSAESTLLPGISTARELPVNLDLGRASGGKDQVADFLGGAQHAGQKHGSGNRVRVC